jgi:hypothetical protein
MGFIPIITTLSAAIILFFLTVNYSLNTKKNKVINLQRDILQALKKLGLLENQLEDNQSNKLLDLQTIFKNAKAKVDKDNTDEFIDSVQAPYRALKLTLIQYNNTIAKNPYTFVAKLMGHQEIKLK